MTGSSCKKFGVTFHKNMDLNTIVNQWKKVPAAIREADVNATLNDAMLAAELALQAQSAQVSITENAKDALNTSTEVVTASAAVQTGNFAYIATKAADVVAEAAQEAENLVIESQKDAIFDQLC